MSSHSRKRRRDRIAAAGSLLVHLLFAIAFTLLVPHLFVTPKPDRAAPSQTITFVKRPRPTPPPPTPPPTPPPPQPRRSPQPRAVVRPAAPRPPAAAHALVPHVVAKAAVVPRHVAHVALAPVPRRKAARPAPQAAPVDAGPAARPAPRGKARLSQTQIARIEGDLSQAIGRDRGAIDPLDVHAPAPVYTPKDYGASYTAFADIGDTKRGHGLCDPVKNWTDGGWNYYYVACDVRFTNGQFERQSVPWPVRFSPDNDPFAGTARRDLPLAMPLPDWHEPPGTVISDQLRLYAKDKGVNL